MDIEVSLKVRSAIKAKLVEMGCHIDEELPDYIMVLVANRRTRTHMNSDLALFLGDNTPAFTLWLHHVLKKLEQVTTTGGKSFYSGASGTAFSIDLEDKSDSEAEESSAQSSKEQTASSSKGGKRFKGKKDEEEASKKRLKSVKDGSSSLKSKGSSSSTTSSSPKKIKLKRNNLERETEDKDKHNKDTRPAKSSKLSPSKKDRLKKGNSKTSSKDSPVIGEPTGKEEELDEKPPLFKLPMSKKSTKLAKKNDAEDEFEDCLNLKADSDEFSEPKPKLVIPLQGKIKIKLNPAWEKEKESSPDALELEMLRQQVMDSTMKRRKSDESESDGKSTESPPKVKSSESDNTESNSTSNAKGDRKKISSRNIESINQLLKSSTNMIVATHRERERGSDEVQKLKTSPVKHRGGRQDLVRYEPRRSRDGGRGTDDRSHERYPERERSSHKRKPSFSPEPPPKQLKSSIGSVIKRPMSSRLGYQAEEEYDPNCPEVVVTNKLSSIIKIPESSKRPKPSGGEGTNKKLLFRAMADAEKSLLQTNQFKSQYEEKKSEHDDEEKNNSHQQETYYPSRTVGNKKKSVHERLGYVDKVRRNTVEVKRVDLMDEFEYPPIPPEADDDDDLEMSDFGKFEGHEKIIINVPNECNIGRNVVVESNNSEANKSTPRKLSDGYAGQLGQPKRISIQVHPDDEDEDSSEADDDDDENNNDMERSDFTGRSEENSMNPSTPDHDASNGGNENDYDIIISEPNSKLPSPDYTSEMENSEIGFDESMDSESRDNSLLKKLVSKSKIQITVTNDNMQSASSSPVPQGNSTSSNSTTKIFYPALPFQPATLQQQQQQQPSTSQQQICKFWPNCTFNDKCMFTHPPCKFNTKCSKPNCPYKHVGFGFAKTPANVPPPHILAKKSFAGVGPSGGGSGTSKGATKTCIYFPKCHSLACPFFHPTPCRYGTGCNDINCKNYHPGATLATKKFKPGGATNAALFKWKAPTITTAESGPKSDVSS